METLQGGYYTVLELPREVGPGEVRTTARSALVSVADSRRCHGDLQEDMGFARHAQARGTEGRRGWAQSTGMASHRLRTLQAAQLQEAVPFQRMPCSRAVDVCVAPTRRGIGRGRWRRLPVEYAQS